MTQYICKICSHKFEKYSSLRIHSAKTHKISSKQTYVDCCLNGIWPTCKCGCCERVNPLPRADGTSQIWIRGHIARVHNNWGHNEEAKRKSKETRKIRGINPGCCKETGEVWNKGLTKETDSRIAEYSRYSTKEINPQRAKKISVSLKEKYKNGFAEEHRANISKGRLSSNKAKATSLINIQKANKVTSFRNNKLEKFLSDKFNLNNSWKTQEYVGKHIVDFVNHDLKKVIEVYGDYWHCNPNGYKVKWLAENYNERIKMTAQEKWEVDKKRIKEIEKAGYSVLVIWETDLKYNLNKVQQKVINFI